MSNEQNKAIVRHFVDEAQSLGKLDAIDEFMTPDFVDYCAPAGLPVTREGVKMQFTMLRSAFPDMQAVIHEQIAEEDRVATCKSLRGTHLGDFLGIAATGKSVSIEVIDILRLVDGKICEHHNTVDLLGLLQQLGVALAPLQP